MRHIETQIDNEVGADDRAQRCLVMIEVLRRINELLCQDEWRVPATHLEAAITALEAEALHAESVSRVDH